jgi:hypothetical protein
MLVLNGKHAAAALRRSSEGQTAASKALLHFSPLKNQKH